MLDSRLRLASAVLALVSIGLLLSLLPRTSFISHSADAIVDAVGPVWPEQSVEQVLGEGLGIVSEVRIWAAAQFDHGEAPVVAALLQGLDRELVRQLHVNIQASKTLQPYELRFAPYQPLPGETLILQFWVSPERSNYAIFGTTEPGSDRTGPTLNLNPTDQGPLAYEVIWRGDGWRAALAGSPPEAIRFGGGIAATILAILLRLFANCTLRRVLRRSLTTHSAPIASLTRSLTAATPRLAPSAQQARSLQTHRNFYVFPWLIPAFAILHYLAANLVILRIHEAIVPTLVIMAGVTAVFGIFRILLKSSASAALITALLASAFSSYGHIYTAPEEQPDSRYLLGLGLPLCLGLAMFLRRRPTLSHLLGRILNISSVFLVAVPLSQIAIVLLAACNSADTNDPNHSLDIDEQIAKARSTIPANDMRDIYYIILDGYPRDGSPSSFDNSGFVQQLTDRGFYVDPGARSNYIWTPSSTTSSLNMNYVPQPVHWDSPKPDIYRAYQTILNHALGRILTDLGYQYVHISSGWFMTTTSRNADIVVDFTPSGHITSGYIEADPITHYHYTIENAFNISNRFMTHFLQTTYFKHFNTGVYLSYNSSGIYDWNHPHRYIEWTDYMMEVADLERPKFVFTHLVKPHYPYHFDRHGNIAQTTDSGGNVHFSEWSDDHDRTVDGAFYGQIAWLNERLLEVIDAILSKYNDPPIIVILGDHGYRLEPEPANTHDILAAYLLPNGGSSAIYPSITPVNAFRMILNYYFDLELERLEDRII